MSYPLGREAVIEDQKSEINRLRADLEEARELLGSGYPNIIVFNDDDRRQEQDWLDRRDAFLSRTEPE